MSNPCYCIVLRKASRKLTALYDEALEPFGINIAQFSMIKSIGRNAPISLTDLADRLELDRSTVGRNAKVLERLKLVAFSAGDDQREALLTLSKEGRARLETAMPVWDAVQRDIESRMSPHATKGLQELLSIL